jgi:hypothetical protein
MQSRPKWHQHKRLKSNLTDGVLSPAKEVAHSGFAMAKGGELWHKGTA